MPSVRAWRTAFCEVVRSCCWGGWMAGAGCGGAAGCAVLAGAVGGVGRDIASYVSTIGYRRGIALGAGAAEPMITGSGGLAVRYDSRAAGLRLRWKIFLAWGAFAGRVGRKGRDEIRACRLSSVRRVLADVGALPTIAGRAGGRCAPDVGRSGDIAQQLLDRKQPLRVRHFQQAEFEMETLFLLVAQLAMSAEHDLQVAREIFFAEQIRDARDAFALFAGNLEQGGVFAGDLGDRGVAQEADHLTREVSRAVAFADQVVDLRSTSSLGASRNACITSSRMCAGAAPTRLRTESAVTRPLARGDGLIEDGESVAHGAVAGFGEQGESVVIGFDFFAARRGRAAGRRCRRT